MPSRCSYYIIVGLLALRPPVALADVIYKTEGGKVEGSVLQDESTPEVLVVKTKFGKIKIARSDIKRIEQTEAPAASSTSYADAVKQHADTADDQFKLAQWCLQHGFKKEGTLHLQRAIELEPDHLLAREKLGYVQVDGKWLTKDEAMQAQGYVKHNGRWVLPQERDQLKAKQEQTEQQKAYYSKVRMWHKWLSDSERRTQAMNALREIEDPQAIPALEKVLGEDKNPKVRELLADVLGGIESPLSTRILLHQLAIKDADPAVSRAAAKALALHPTPSLLAETLPYLKSKENSPIRRAGLVLEKIGDISVASALVDALVTEHFTKVTPSLTEMANSQFNQTFTVPTTVIIGDTLVTNPTPGIPAPRSGMNVDMSGATKIKREVRHNDEVLDALIAITGQNFRFEKNRWIDWLAQRERQVK